MTNPCTEMRTVPLTSLCKDSSLEQLLKQRGWLNAKQAAMYLGVTYTKLRYTLGKIGLDDTKAYGLYRLRSCDLKLLQEELFPNNQGESVT